MRLKSFMTPRFSVLEESSSIDEARSKFANADYLVLTDGRGAPLTVITARDLPPRKRREFISLKESMAKLPPTVIIGCDRDASSIAESPTEYLFKNKTRGAILMGDKGVEGVLPVAVMKAYLEGLKTTIPGGGFQVKGFNIAAAAGLGGRRRPPAVPRTCTKCGYLASYPYILKTTICKNPDTTVEPQPYPHTLGS
jgi:hypothetical protein